MDRLRSMEVFAAVAEAGSFAGPPGFWACPPPAVTRAIAALEERLGVRLLNRTTRSLGLTEPGQAISPASAGYSPISTRPSRSPPAPRRLPEGHLRLTAPVTFGRMHLMPVLTDFLRAQPKLTATLGHARPRGEPDRGRFRRGAPDRPTAGFHDRRAPDRHGATPARRIPGLSRATRHAAEALRPGRTRSDRVRGSVRPQANGASSAMAEPSPSTSGLEWRSTMRSPQSRQRNAGTGITGALSYMVAAQLAAGSLVTVLDDFSPPPVPVQLVYPQGRLVARQGPRLRRLRRPAARPRARMIGGYSGASELPLITGTLSMRRTGREMPPRAPSRAGRRPPPAVPGISASRSST